MFSKHQHDKQTVILIYVNDLLITSDDDCEIHKSEKGLDQAFTFKDLGEMRYFFGE